MRSRVESAAGAVGVLAFGALLPLGWWALPAHEDLAVSGPQGVPWSALGDPSTTLPVLSVSPPALRARLTREGALESPGTGLSWRTYQVEYGHRWERAVYFPTLTGPFAPSEGTWPCAFSVRVGAGLFNGSVGTQGLSRRVTDTLRPQFGRGYGIAVPFLGELTITRFGALVEARATLRPDTGRLDAEVALSLDDGTRMRVAFPVTLGRNGDGALTVARAAPPVLTWTGPSHDQAMAWCQGVGLVPLLGTVCRSVADWAVDAVLSDRIDQALEALTLAQSVPLPGPGGVTLSPRIDAPPRVTPRGVSFRVCPRVRVERPRDATVPGPVLRALAPVPLPEDSDPGAVFAVMASQGALDQALWIAWQGGALGALGEALRTRLPREFAMLAFDVTSLAPALPPVTRSSPQELRVDVADVALGTLADREVRAHATLALEVQARAGAFTLQATPLTPRLDCVERHPPYTGRRVPCLSDLGPVARERRWQPVRFTLEGATLDALLRLRFAGVTFGLQVAEVLTNLPYPSLRGSITAL